MAKPMAKGLKLFEKVDPKLTKPGVPPLVFMVAPDSHIVLDTPAKLKQWEGEISKRLGVDFRAAGGIGTCSCSGGCADDCDEIQ